MPSFPDPYGVRQYGVDSSGRGILMNARMHYALEVACRRLDFTPTVTQGAYMSRVPGGGADASAGYHDEGGCLDFRTTSRSELNGAQIDQLVRALRSTGWAAWRRDARHGMDPHLHAVLLGDKDAAWGALSQMAEYRAGGDGLSGSAGDYEWRPDPLVTFDYYQQFKEDRMLAADIAKAVREDGQKTRDLINTRAQGDAERDRDIAAQLTEIEAKITDAATKKQIQRLREQLKPTEEI